MPATDLPAIWGKRLAERRIAAGLAQDELAAAVGISRPYLSKLENGHHAPSDAARIRLARALSTTVPDLFPHDLVEAAPEAVA